MSGSGLSGNTSSISDNLPMPLWEFVGLLAGLMSLNALAIDVMLPALENVGHFYNLKNDNDQQLIIFAYIAGFGAPQLVFGPISDRYGRKRVLQLCLIGYILMSFACMIAGSFTALLITRFLQGIMAAGIRVVSVSIVRDVLVGRSMAKVMSLIFTVFMILPILAPQIGQLIMFAAHWSWTFGSLGVLGLIYFVWLQFRLPETLPETARRPLNVSASLSAYSKVIKTPVAFGYTCAAGVIFGSMFAFIAASPQIFADVFDKKDTYPLWFGGIAIMLAVANILNSTLVEKVGMRRISHGALLTIIVLSALNAIQVQFFGPNLWIFFPLFALAFGCFGMLGSNFSALALEPLGEIAGTASAAYGFATTTLASFLGYLVASQFNGSVVPFLLGYVVLGLASLGIVLLTEKGRLFQSR